MIKRVLTIGLVSWLLTAASFAVPTKMNFQGRLTDTSGNPITTAVDVKFSIFDASSGGSELWTETIAGLTPDQGLVNQELGITTAITSAIFSGDTRYLAVKVGTDAEMAPRVPLATVPFAFRAAVADAVAAGQVVTSVASSGSVTTLKDNIVFEGGSGVTISQNDLLNKLTITAVSTAGGTVSQVNTGTGLTGGPITSSGTVSIANGGVAAGQLATGAVTAGAIADDTITEQKLNIMNGPTTNYTLTYTATGLAWGSSGGTGTVTQVNTGSGLTGGPINTTGTVSIANGGITAAHLGTGIVTSGAIASGQIVTSVTSQGSGSLLRDAVALVGGTGITLGQAGQTITISATSSAPDLSGYVKLGPTTVQSTTSAYGINVKTTNASGIGISVETTASGGYGVYGANGSASNGGTGGYFKGGTKSAVGNFSIGVMGRTASGNNYGQLGREAPTAMDNSTDSGVYGYASTLTGHGVYGLADATTGAGNNGGYFEADGDTGTGVYGYGKSSAAGKNFGVYGRTDSGNGYGVYGSGASDGFGVYGYVNATAMNSIALCGETAGADGYALVTKNGPVSFETSSVDINAVHYTWPSSNPGSATVLTNNGAGALSWAPSGGVDLSGYVKLGPLTQQSTTAAYGINVKTTNASGVGISGEATTNGAVGIYGLSSYNNVSGPGNAGYGVYGLANSYGGHGIHGVALAGDGADNVGVYGYANGNQGWGVMGRSSNGPSGKLGGNYGVRGDYDGSNYGLVGGSGTGTEGHGTTYGAYGGGGTYGVYGTGATYGGYFHNNNSAGYALGTWQQDANGYSMYMLGGRNYIQGNTGIGTDNPQALLHVQGNLRVTGTIEGASPVKFKGGDQARE